MTVEMMSRSKQWLCSYSVREAALALQSEVNIDQLIDDIVITIAGGKGENRPITIAHIVQHTMVYR